MRKAQRGASGGRGDGALRRVETTVDYVSGSAILRWQCLCDAWGCRLAF